MFRKPILHLFFIFTFVLTNVYCHAQKQAVDPALINVLYSQGVEQYLIGETQGAVQRFQTIASATNDAHTPSLYYLSRIAYENADTVAAMGYIARAVKVEPDNVQYLKLQAQYLLESNQLSEAMYVLERVLDFVPNDRETMVFKILCQFFSGQQAEAVDDIKDFEKQFGMEDRLSQIKRQYFIEKKRFKELLEYTERLVRADPSVAKIITLAQTQASLGQDSTALESYNRALTLSGENDVETRVAIADYWRIKGNQQKMKEAVEPLLLGDKITAKGKIQLIVELMKLGLDPRSEASKALLAAVVAGSDDVEITEYYADYLIFLEDYSGALSQFRKLYDQGVLSPQRTFGLAQLYYMQKEPEKALEVAEKVLQEDPANIEMAPLALFLNTELKQFDRALMVANGMVKFAVGDSLKSVAYGSRGDMYHQIGNMSKCFADYKKALIYNPNNTLVLNNYAYFITTFGKGNLNKALEMSELSNKLSPQNPTYLDTKAWVLYKLNRLADAKQAILLVIGLDKNPSAEVMLHAADIFQALGDTTTAENYRQRAKQLQ